MLEPNAAHPPGTPLVRCYRMEYSGLTGWKLPQPANAFMHFPALFFI
jgi:hypothetical protein